MASDTTTVPSPPNAREATISRSVWYMTMTKYTSNNYNWHHCWTWAFLQTSLLNDPLNHGNYTHSSQNIPVSVCGLINAAISGLLEMTTKVPLKFGWHFPQLRLRCTGASEHIPKNHWFIKDDTVEAIVIFLKTLWKHSSLNKTQIGDYLGGAKPFNISVVYAFIDSIDFSEMGLDNGIRKLCTYFKLPGEAAQIDRIRPLPGLRGCLAYIITKAA